MVFSLMRFVFILLFLSSTAYAQTYNDDYSLITEINRQRILHGIPHTLITNHALQQSARVLVQNHAYFLCNASHETCQGQSLQRRIKRFYGGRDGFTAGEAWGLGFDIENIVTGFINSPTHNAIIFGDYEEIGAGLVARQDWIGTIGEAAVDVGTRALYPDGTPVISGAVYGGYAWLTYEATNPPKAAFVTLGDKDYSLKFYEGKPNYGIYRTELKIPSGCEKVFFTVLTDYDTPIVYPSGVFQNLIGDLCDDSPSLLNKVRISINATGNRLFKGTLNFNLETLPNENPKSLIITYGKNGVIVLPTEPFIKRTSNSTKLRGSYRANTIPKAEAGIVNVYLDYRLVASLYPRRVQPNYIEVLR